MKIGITCYPTYGGSGIVATELGLELARRGHQVHFISYSQPIRLTEPQPNIHYHEVEVSRYPLFEYPPYDHARNSRRLPYVTTLHGTDITLVGADPSYLPITRFSIDQSDGVTSISEYLKKRTFEVFEAETPIRVIPNFVNCDVYHRTVEAMKGRSEYARENEKILVHLSNFRPVKRVTDVIEIFERVQKQVPSRLVLIGDGPERSRAEWLAVHKGIHDKIEFLGKQDRVHEKLAVADVLLLPSQLESFGLAALEAMACEVVPIATNAGGVPEVIDHGETGFLADVGDVDAMAGYAIEVLSDDERLKRMGEQARAAAQARFCASKIIPMYER